MPDLLKIMQPPQTPELHVLADYAEIRSLVDADGAFGEADLANDLHDFHELRDGVDDEGDEDDEGDDPPAAAAPPPKATDKAESVFQHLAYRTTAFPDSYPFEMPSPRQLKRKEPLNDEQKLYVFLLLASNTAFFAAKGSARSFTSAFEEISLVALRRFLPAGSQAHRFHRGAHFTGNKLAKVKKLATSLQEQFVGFDHDFSANDSGDAGLDLVGWLPLADAANGRLALFAQCACTKEWVSKQSSSDENAWGPLINFRVPPANFCFIPFCFRRTDGTWYVDSKVRKRTLLIDRLRLLNVVKADVPTIVPLLPAALMQDALDQRVVQP